MKADSPRVLVVGQCDFDHENIGRVLRGEFGADVDRAATADEANKAVRSRRHDLVLVNRILDADGSSGLDLIGQLRSDEELRRTPVALVSNYAEAQEAAIALGAKRGFGKSDLASTATRAQLASLLGL